LLQGANFEFKILEREGELEIGKKTTNPPIDGIAEGCQNKVPSIVVMRREGSRSTFY
jgi:hypothetical protein